MKTIMNFLTILLLVLPLMSFTACGGGGGNDNPPPVQTRQQAVVSLSLSGGIDTLGTLQFELLLPEGFNLAVDEQGQLLDGVLTTSLTTSALVSPRYQPEEGQNSGQLTLALISAEGFNVGASATLMRNLASDETLPLASDFTLSNLIVTDLNGVELSGYNLEIGVNQQTLDQ